MHLLVIAKLVKKIIHPLKQKYAERHAHYRFENFFHFQTDAGVVTDWNDGRNFFANEDFIIGLIEGLEEEIGSASTVVMYNIGYEWGNQDAQFFQDWFEKEYQKKILEANSIDLLHESQTPSD